MRYQCNSCKKAFMFTAKQTLPLGEECIADNYKKDAFIRPSIEVQVCPYCSNIDISEFVEPLPEITSVKSVDLAQVDDYLKQGYTVKELYAKTATLVLLKTAPVDATPASDVLGDTIRAGIEKAKQDA